MMLQHLVQSRNDNYQLKAKIDEMSNREEGLGSTLIEYLICGVGPSERNKLGKSLRDGMLSAIYDSIKLPDNDASAFEIPRDRKVILEKKFLSKLQYDGMHDRELMVAEAHRTTFRWIFEAEEGQQRPWANFRHWLESDHQLYWITGKAGSGKSTLMKFISQPISSEKAVYSEDGKPRCTEYLLRWAKEKPLLVASFYFWAAGSKIQTSKEGLYRTLLSQILRACPGAISHTSPERWEALCLFNEDSRPLRESELRSILSKAIAFVNSTMRMCLFIDGLDEFDGQLDGLIRLVKETIETSSVKICVASRPWVVFEDALKDKPSLMLEDLTYNDIKEYVTSTLESDADFLFLQEIEAEFAGDLIEKVVRKASGVFLWVSLVVSSLLDGMRSGDRVSDLQLRLDQLPSDLETLYDRILDNLDPFYLNHAAQYFYLMLACTQPPEALLLSFADEEGLDFALQLPNKPLSDKEIRNRIETMRRRMNSRCRGLIGIPKLVSGVEDTSIRKLKVQYLHKTVKDYIEQPSVQKKLSGMIKTPFDPHIRLCSGALAICKTHESQADQSSDLERHRKLFQCMHHASKVLGHSVPAMIGILDELKRTVSSDQGIFSDISILKEAAEGYEQWMVTDNECFGDCFLSLAVKYQVAEYVKRRTGRGCLVLPNKKPLRPWSLPHHPPQQPKKSSWNPMKLLGSGSNVGNPSTLSEWPLLLDAVPSWFTTPAMVTALLQNGADPNFVINRGETKSSIWIETLALVVAIYSSQSSYHSDMWVDILQIMIRHGANMETKTIGQALKLAASVHGVPAEEQKVTLSGLQQLFREMRFGAREPDSGFSLDDAKGPGRMTSTTYNPYNNSHIKLQIRKWR
jgi:energy-coupling factor transporter ATP-binding protein EcfA2